jgi:outer membrane lipopolysaccharide assembly protein LptE/RlpB
VVTEQPTLNQPHIGIFVIISRTKTKGRSKMANSKLLKEAIADAKAVRETAIANAKIALEEAFAPRLQAALSRKIQAEMEDMDDEEEVNEEYSDGSEAPDEDASDIGTGDNKQPADDANSSSELAKGNPDTEVETSEVGKEEEDYDVVSEGDEDEVPGEDPSKLEEEEEEDEDEFDLAEIIRELESELDGEEEMHEEEDEMYGQDSEEEAPVAEEEDEMYEEDEMDSEEEMPAADGIDLDEILREMGYGDDEEEMTEEEENGEDMAAEMAEKEAELDEAYKVIKSLKKTINEVNLLNAKLLYTNKLFRSYNLTTEQKHKVVETLDRTGNVREVKLVFSTLAESLKMGGTSKKVKQTKLTESFASKKVASTAPKKEIISESNQLAERFKQLANIK